VSLLNGSPVSAAGYALASGHFHVCGPLWRAATANYVPPRALGSHPGLRRFKGVDSEHATLHHPGDEVESGGTAAAPF